MAMGSGLKPARLQRVVAAAGLDVPTIILMFKGSIPPLIGIAMYQSATVSNYFTTQGYLIPIISVLAVPILPRDKFLQNLILSVLFICIGSAVSLLAIWSSVQARIHTSPPTAHGAAGAPLPYNSSQSAVCAVWLFVNIWLANLIRAKMPSFNLAVVLYSILVNTSMTTGTTIGTTAAAESFVRELLLANLIGVGLATGVCLVIFPFSSRMIVMGEFRRLIGLQKDLVRLQGEHFARLAQERKCSTGAMDGRAQDAWREERKNRSKTLDARAKDTRNVSAAPTASALDDTVREIRHLAGELYGNYAFAKRDAAWGKLDAKDIADIFTLLYNITIPLVAINTSIRILDGVYTPKQPKTSDDKPTAPEEEGNATSQAGHGIAEQFHAPFQLLAESIGQGLEHAGICLEILPQPTRSKKVAYIASGTVNVDIEGHGGQTYPGDERFGVLVKDKISNTSREMANVLRTWLKERLATEERDATDSQPLMVDDTLSRSQAELCVSLYLEQLTLALSEAVQNTLDFAKKKASNGTMEHKRLIIPCKYGLRKWLRSILAKRNSSTSQDVGVVEESNLYYGDGYNEKKDPESLPPTGPWQHIGSGLCNISRVLGSKESAFGFRVACAAMSVSVLAFLEKTQQFFQNQRLLWAMFTIALGMTITSGQSVFGFFCRVTATGLAMISSFAIWYIPDQKVPGIIVFLWLFIFVEYYFIKFPRLMSAVIVMITTQLVIIGYELQVEKIGETVATRSGQPYYPIYLLGPYRLAVIAGGCVVAFFWTFFPCALTDRTWLRQDLSAMMYLLGNYFGVLSSNAGPLLEDGVRKPGSPATPGYKLAKARRKSFGKFMRLMSSVESHLMWQHWEPAIGGKFPTKTYEDIFASNTRIMGYLILMSYALTYRPPMGKEHDTLKHNETLELEVGTSESWTGSQAHRIRRPSAKALQRLELTQHTILSTLTMLSNAMLSGQRLPPFVPIPQHGQVTRSLTRLLEIDTVAESNGHDDLVPTHLISSRDGDVTLRLIDLRQKQHGYTPKKLVSGENRFRRSDFGDANSNNAKTQDPLNMGLRIYFITKVCGALICDELEGLARAVSRLVGIVDLDLYVDASKTVDNRKGQAVETLSQDVSSASVGKGKSVVGAEAS